MEEYTKYLAVVGPLAVFGLAMALRALRRFIEARKANKPAGEEIGPLGAFQDEVAPLPEPITPPYDPEKHATPVQKDMLRVMRSAVVAADAGIAHAPDNRTALTINPDGTTDAKGLAKDERAPGPGGDGLADISIREAPIPPATIRPYSVRQFGKALADGYYKVDGGVTAHPMAEEEAEHKIEAFERYRDNLNTAAEADFAQALVEIKADAAKMAGQMALASVRAAQHAAEATERQVPVEQVNQEFVDMVVADAVKKATDAYHSTVSISRLTGGHIKDKGYFGFDDKGERRNPPQQPQILRDAPVAPI